VTGIVSRTGILYIITVPGTVRMIVVSMYAFECDFPFCGNPRCELHVRPGDPGVLGIGNWAQLPDGRLIGRGWYGGEFLCDVCGRAALGTDDANTRFPRRAFA